jgi:phasin family protein
MNEQIAATTRIVEEVVSRSQQALEGLVSASKDQAEKASQALKTSIAEINDLSQQNVKAVVASGTIVARGVEEAGQDVVAFSQKSTEASLSTLRKLAKVTSITDAVEIQRDFAKDSVAAAVAETERLSALAATITRNAIAPINDRIAATIALMTRPLAA